MCGIPAHRPPRAAPWVSTVSDLDQARQKARHWLDLIGKGIDPADVIASQKIAQERRKANSFRAVAEDFIAEKLTKERKGAEVRRDIEQISLDPGTVARLPILNPKTLPRSSR